jgi:hypothetical protein
MWLVSKGATVPRPPTAVFDVDQHGYARNVAHVPGTWYVYDAAPWASHQVMLMVGPTRTQPAVQTPQPGTPVASPSA